MTLTIKSLGLAAVLLTLGGCSTMSNINDNISSTFRNMYSNKPEVVGRQPLHLMPHKKQLFLHGPVKTVSYFITRPDFSGTQITDEVHIEFNREGYMTQITGNKKALRTNDFLKYWNLPANTKIEYDENNVLDKIASAKGSHQYEYKGGPEEYSEKTGNMRSVILNHVLNSEQKYRTLDYIIYSGNRYMVLSKDNRKREQTVARIYEFENDRLHKVYFHENDYPLDKKPSQALQDPLKYRFTLEKQINYDLQGRIHHVMSSQRKGALISEDRISYHINSKNPKRVTNVNGTGSQQYRIRYSDYEQDQNENWVSRKVVTTYRRGDKEGSDTRKIKYFEKND
jgi:hypothetical protein